MTTSFNGYQNLANRTVNLADLANKSAVDGTLVLAKDGRTIYQFVKDGSSFTVDSSSVYTTLDGGNSRWVGISGQKNYFNLWKITGTSDIYYNDGKVVVGLSSIPSFTSSITKLIVGTTSGSTQVAITAQTNAFSILSFSETTAVTRAYIRYDYTNSKLEIVNLDGGSIRGLGLNKEGVFSIGTTMGATSNAKLHIYDTSTPYILIDRGAGVKSYIGTTSSAMFLQPYSTLEFQLYVNGGNRIVVKTDGKIGLKTSSPTTDVDINGVLRIRGGSPVAGYYLTCDADGICSWAAGGGSGGSSTFIGLTDTPSSFSGQAGKTIRVNAGETALEYVALSGSGTVTSVGLSGITGFISVSGSPITASGTISLSLNTQSANVVFAGPSSGSAATPEFRSLVSDDIPSLSTSKITSGYFNVNRGGTGLVTVDENSYLKGNGTSALVPRTYSEVRTDLGLVIGTNIQAYSQRLDQLAAISPLQGDLIYADSSAIWKRLPKNTNATRYLSNTGKDNQPFWALVNLENGVLGVLHPTKGGTGLSEYRYGDMLYGVAPNNLSVLEVGNENEVIASTGTFPAYKKLHQIQDAFASFTSDQNASWDTSVGLNKKWSIDGDYSLTISNLQNGMFGALKIEVTDVATVTLIVSGITTEGHGSLEELDINTYMFCFAYDGDTLKWNIADYE